MCIFGWQRRLGAEFGGRRFQSTSQERLAFILESLVLVHAIQFMYMVAAPARIQTAIPSDRSADVMNGLRKQKAQNR